MSRFDYQDSLVVENLDASVMENAEDDDMGIPDPVLTGPTTIPNMLSESAFGIREDEISEGESESEEEDLELQAEMNLETQRVLLRTFDEFYKQESQTMLSILANSREEIKDSMVELVEEQNSFKEDLIRVSEGRYTNTRKKENSIPLAVYIRRKRGDTPGTSMQGSMSSNINLTQSTADLYINQHPTERMAVEKYIKKKERKKVAEYNRIEREQSEAEVSNQIGRILSGIQGTADIKEKERERQMERINMKLKSARSQPKKKEDVVNEILETYNDTQLAFEREKQQQEKRFQRVLTAKQGRASEINPPNQVPNIDI